MMTNMEENLENMKDFKYMKEDMNKNKENEY